MTLAPMSETIRPEIMRKKDPMGNKITKEFGNVKLGVRIVLLSNQHKVSESRRSELNKTKVIFTTDLFLCEKGGYSSDIKSFGFCSALNPDSSICMDLL
jgi:hypothetical protein